MDTTTSKTSNKPNIKEMCVIGVMTAVVCVIAPWSLSIPVSPVPISLGSLAIYFALMVLGMKCGTIVTLLYILIGLVGVPVFSGLSGGAGKLLGPTGGYIVGYIFMALICGFFLDKWRTNLNVKENIGRKNLALSVLGMVLGTIVLYAFGTAWLAISLNMTFPAALAAGVIPYIPGDIVKLIIAMVVGGQVRKALLKAGLL